MELTQSPVMLSSVQNLLGHVERKKSKSLDKVRAPSRSDSVDS